MLFLRTKFICIIWTNAQGINVNPCSWGLSLFVLFEPLEKVYSKFIGSWGLSLFVLFEPLKMICACSSCSWGLSLFVLFELNRAIYDNFASSWGLSLFVLFERMALMIIWVIVLED